ncbi:dystrobrevin binding protein 1b isoform X5 [Phyllopteryx taeniolatus]|uniref:dystrobrevin binding protein 1b isoform X5 n=1 Tax=Phyllopteryx taeniolatus TaxID=161469 RepID=UPI002AD46024|nr:dystrobrevin binding protein 1b isoform X5 [Phyllopteryx taeniolatus]
MSTSPSAAEGSQRNSLEVERGGDNAAKAPAGAESAGGQLKLRDRHKLLEEAFQQDVEQYLSTGYLQIAERRGSMSSMEVNVDMLEQMDLMDMSDHEALDVFLHSGGEDNSATSPVAGPDSLTTEISLQVPTQVELRDKLSSLSSTCARRDGDEEDDDEEEDEEEEEGGARATTRRRRRKRAPPLVMAPDCGSGTPKV